MKILKILGICLILVVISFIGYHHIVAKEITVTDTLQANRHIRFTNDVAIIQKLPQNDIELKEIQIQFGTYSAQKKTKNGVLTVTLLENDNAAQQWLLHAENLIDNAYQPFSLDKAIKLNPENTYTLEISYHYTDDNFIAIWTNKDAKNGSFKNGKQTLTGSICYKLGYLQ